MNGSDPNGHPRIDLPDGPTPPANATGQHASSDAGAATVVEDTESAAEVSESGLCLVRESEAHPALTQGEATDPHRNQQRAARILALAAIRVASRPARGRTQDDGDEGG